MSKIIGVGVVGYGYWGPNLVRNLMANPDCRVRGVSDLREKQMAAATLRYPGVLCTTDCSQIMNHPDIDAVVIATPVSSHYPLAMQALKAGKHVLVEKPLASSSEQCQALIEEAARRNLVLMVDHTFIYTGAVRKIKELVEGGHLGSLYYYDSVRVNLGLFQHDVNVLWDLAVHDLAIMDYVLGQRPLAVAATGVAHMAGHPENIAFLTCFFANNLIAHFHVNWLAPVKIRRTLIGGSQKMIVYDDLEPSEKIKVYDKGINWADTPEGVYRMINGYRTGDMWAPQLAASEALGVEVAHFIDCIGSGAKPVTDGAVGRRVVQILEAASASMAQRGHPVELEG